MKELLVDLPVRPRNIRYYTVFSFVSDSEKHIVTISRKGRLWMSHHRIQDYYKHKLLKEFPIRCGCLHMVDCLIAHNIGDNLGWDVNKFFYSYIVKAKIKHQMRLNKVENSPLENSTDVQKS